MSAAITINRAPVLTLWGAVVAERLGFARDEALTLGRAVAGMNAQAKAVKLGLREPKSAAEKAAKKPTPAAERVELLGRAIPVVRMPNGVRAAKDGRADSPEAVERYLESKFGESLEPAREAMAALAASLPPKSLAEQAFALYESFRPEIPAGVRGWGAKGVLDLAKVRRMATGKGRRA